MKKRIIRISFVTSNISGLKKVPVCNGNLFCRNPLRLLFSIRVTVGRTAYFTSFDPHGITGDYFAHFS